jgi:hypothetical protein
VLPIAWTNYPNYGVERFIMARRKFDKQFKNAAVKLK